MKRSDSSLPLVRRFVACVALGVVLVSCGDDDDSATATTVADVCADREALGDSVDVLTNVDVVAEGTNGVSAAVSDVEDDLAALRSLGRRRLGARRCRRSQDALDELETAVDEIDSGWRLRRPRGGVRAGRLGGDVARLVGGRRVWSIDDVVDVSRFATVTLRIARTIDDRDPHPPGKEP